MFPPLPRILSEYQSFAVLGADADASNADPSATYTEAARAAGDHALLLPLGQAHGSSGDGADNAMLDTCNDGASGEDAVLRPASLAHDRLDGGSTQPDGQGGTQAVEG